MTPREVGRAVRDPAFVDFMRRLGVVVGAVLAVVTLTSMVVKQTVAAGSAVLSEAVGKSVASELRPVVQRLEHVERYSRATAYALHYMPGTPERARILALLDSLDVQSAADRAAGGKPR